MFGKKHVESSSGAMTSVANNSQAREFDAVVIHPNMSMLGGGEMLCFLTIASLLEHNQKVGLISDRIEDRELAIEYKLSGAAHAQHLNIRTMQPGFFRTYPQLLRLWKELRLHRRLNTQHIVLTQSLLPGLPSRPESQIVLYVQYPDLSTDESTSRNPVRRAYLSPARVYLEKQLRDIDLILCISNFTKHAIQSLWDHISLPEPIVVYPATLRELEASKTWELRANRVIYIGRFSPFKRHEIIRDLATRNSGIEFWSLGSAIGVYDAYVDRLLHNRPMNYSAITNAPRNLISASLESSKVYVHAAENEHFGIAALEAMTAGCVPLVHDSGGIREIVPRELRWNTLDELEIMCRRLLSDREYWETWHDRVVEVSRQYSPNRCKAELARAILQS